MGNPTRLIERKHGYCVGCLRPFVGPGERCLKCRDDLRMRKRKRRKPR